MARFSPDTPRRSWGASPSSWRNEPREPHREVSTRRSWKQHIVSSRSSFCGTRTRGCTERPGAWGAGGAATGEKNGSGVGHCLSLSLMCLLKGLLGLAYMYCKCLVQCFPGVVIFD